MCVIKEDFLPKADANTVEKCPTLGYPFFWCCGVGSLPSQLFVLGSFFFCVCFVVRQSILEL